VASIYRGCIATNPNIGTARLPRADLRTKSAPLSMVTKSATASKTLPGAGHGSDAGLAVAALTEPWSDSPTRDSAAPSGSLSRVVALTSISCGGIALKAVRAGPKATGTELARRG